MSDQQPQPKRRPDVAALAIGLGAHTRVLVDRLTERLVAPFAALTARFRRA